MSRRVVAAVFWVRIRDEGPARLAAGATYGDRGQVADAGFHECPDPRRRPTGGFSDRARTTYEPSGWLDVVIYGIAAIALFVSFLAVGLASTAIGATVPNTCDQHLLPAGWHYKRQRHGGQREHPLRVEVRRLPQRRPQRKWERSRPAPG
jgi:hypothetical protein